MRINQNEIGEPFCEILYDLGFDDFDFMQKRIVDLDEIKNNMKSLKKMILKVNKLCKELEENDAS